MPEIQQGLERLLKQVDPITEAYHKSKTDFDNLKGQEKTTLAQIACKKEGSESQRNREALADVRYKGYKEAMKMTTEHYNRAWALLNGLDTKVRILQSLNRHFNG